jgi:VIT1/CCC1 family predicted Fe2+/Mn2+ transporter
MFDKLIDGLGKVADNVWAFLLFVMAGLIAIAAHFGHDEHLLTFASSVALTGAALFHGKKEPSS